MAPSPPLASRCRRRPTLVTLLPLSVAVLVAGWMAGCATRPASPPRNALVIVVDTLRWDHVGCYGHERDTTPAVDSLAAEGVRFDAAYSTAPWTKPAVASMLTGLYPSAHGVKTLNDGLAEAHRTLPEILVDHGYRTGGVISHTLLTNGEENRFGQGFELYLEREAKGHRHVSTNGVTEQAIRMLQEFAAGGQPFLIFVHYFDPHFNYVRHPEVGYAAPRAGRLDGTEHITEIVDMRASMTPEEIDFLRDLYDEEISFTDSGIGRLLRALRDEDLDDETVVVF
ncbi:MAG: sulfatase, partial [Acidobacteriota bacterium]|nr:sulfatase [Acidobacteriota bacterium]